MDIPTLVQSDVFSHTRSSTNKLKRGAWYEAVPRGVLCREVVLIHTLSTCR